MKWRKLVFATHRDLGFLCLGLTLIYALSGIAVNHIGDWNPNYSISKVDTRIDWPAFRGVVSETQVRDILARLAETVPYESYFQPDPENLWIYVQGRVVRMNLVSGAVQHEKVERRTFWYPLNFLHLNHPKKAWTVIADLYAVGLALLAVTGLFMLPQTQRLKKRCVWLTVAGFALPLGFLMLYY